jgi:WD40 repeat protein
MLTLRGHQDNLFSVAFSPDGYRIASACIDKTVRIWDATPINGELTPEYLTYRSHTGAVTDVAFHPSDGRSVVSASTDGAVRMWDFRSGKDLGKLHETPSRVRLRVAYSPDGQRLVTASSADPQQPVSMWQMDTAKKIFEFSGHPEPCLSVAFSPDGGHVASAGWGFEPRIWEATTGKELRVLRGHTWPIFGVAFSPNGRHFASGSGDNTVRVWDWTTGEMLRILEPGHAGRITSVAFSRDGQRLASSSWDRTVKVWDADTWTLLDEQPDPAGAVLCVAFGNDHRLAWGSTDSTVKVWDGPGTQTHVLRGHTSWVQAVAVSPDKDGKWIASASLDGTVKIWKAPPAPSSPASEAETRVD